MILKTHSGVACFGARVKMLGTKLDVYSYAVDGILVDTGPSRFGREFAGFFRSQRPDLVVLTHFHEDHTGNAPWLEKQGVPVYIHPLAVDVCRKPARLPLYRRVFWGRRGEFCPSPLAGTLEGKHGSWQALETPGHTPDHIALYSPDRGILFTGDLFVVPRTRLILRNESIPAIIRSLKLLLSKDFQTIYCAHAGVVDNGPGALGSKLDYLETLAGEVMRLYQQGLPVREIDRRLHTGTTLLSLISGREWSSEYIVRSIIEDN